MYQLSLHVDDLYECFTIAAYANDPHKDPIGSLSAELPEGRPDEYLGPKIKDAQGKELEGNCEVSIAVCLNICGGVCDSCTVSVVATSVERLPLESTQLA